MKKILVANRGEIAVRIINACKAMEIETVAIYSEADCESLHIYLADESYQIGEGPSLKSYLLIDSILEIALLTKCDAIHPGYGFLSENRKFCERCSEEGLKFIGPSLENMRDLGDKLNAKKIAEEASVPVVPGSEKEIGSIEQLIGESEHIGFPIILKASAGGGGKGIKICGNINQLEKCYKEIQREASVSFDDDRVYIEKYIQKFMHVEVQIIGDKYGNYIHLGERLCSIQRNMQKIIEEAPAPFLPDRTRMKMCEAAIRLVKKVGYVGVGTVEFIYDYLHDDFYFMEMNTRIQVEHPVSEVLFSFDLLREQIRVADGEKLSVKQKDLLMSGHAIECRINAENSQDNFTPAAGKMKLFIPPMCMPGVRLDSYVYSGYQIPPFYDSMIGKIIVHAKTRDEAITKMKLAIAHTMIEGIYTTLPFLEDVIRDDSFVRGDYDNQFLAQFIDKSKNNIISAGL